MRRSLRLLAALILACPAFAAAANETSPPVDGASLIRVTPGTPEQVIGRTGLEVHARTPSWGHDPHMRWVRPFRSDVITVGVDARSRRTVSLR